MLKMKITVKTKHAGIQVETDEDLDSKERQNIVDNLYRKVKILTQVSKKEELKSPQNLNQDI